MKPTDYCPRAAPFDGYLTGRALIGVEVGVDVGAHAHAMLAHCDIALLHLVDPWEREFYRGYCEGRLAVMGYRMRIQMHQAKSLDAVRLFKPLSLDFIYRDQYQDGDATTADLVAWWPILKAGGVFGVRNYVGRGEPIDKAVDAFIGKQGTGVTWHFEKQGEMVLIKS